MRQRKMTAIVAATLFVSATVAATARANVSFGNFEDGATDGWGSLTNSGLGPFTSPVTGTVIVPTSGADTTHVLDLSAQGFNGGVGGADLGYDFVASGLAAAFMSNDIITFNWEVQPSSVSSGYNQLYNVIINAPGFGFNNVGGVSQGSNDPNITNQSPPYTGQLQTYSFHYDAIKSQITANPGYIQFGIQTNNAGGGAPDFYFDNFTLSTLNGASSWNAAGSGDWNVSTNWIGGVPNAIGAEADLLGTINSNRTVFTDTSITLGTLLFNNSTASYAVTGAVGTSLTMQTSSGSANIEVQAGTHEINLPLVIASNTTLKTDISTASLIIGNPVTVDAGMSLNTSGSGTVTYLSSITLLAGAKAGIASSSDAGALSVNTGSVLSLAQAAQGSRIVLQLTGLTNTGGTVNLGNGAMLVHGGASFSSVWGQVASGYGKGAWNGTGIDSGAAAADTKHLTAVGIIQATTAGTVDGTAYSAGDIVTKYTYYGDSNLDGKVDGSDYSRIDNGYLTHATGWANGDYNYDGVVDGSDYTLIDNAFNSQGSQISAQVAQPTAQIASSAVPEPASAGLLVGLVASSLLRRRRVR